jgi:hypothetical protein
MRFVVGFKAFDTPEERDSLGFHDRPKKSLQGQTLMMTEAIYQSNPALCDDLIRRTGMQLELVSREVYGRDVEPDDTFLVLDIEDGCRPWFGYWEPTGCQFLRDRGIEYPYKWVTPQILDTYNRVVRAGAEPGIVAGSPDAARMLGCDVPPGKVWPAPTQD